MNLDNVPCRRRAIRAWVEENTESIVRDLKGIYLDDQGMIEFWKALDDTLQPTPGLVQYISSDRGILRFWFSARFHMCGLIIFRRTRQSYGVPFGRTADETAKIISGCRKFMLLRAWQEREKGDGK